MSKIKMTTMAVITLSVIIVILLFWLGKWGTEAVSTSTPLTVSTANALEEPIFPFYGTQYVLIDELPFIRQLGFTVVLNDFSYEASPTEWIAYLNAAQAQNLKVIAWLWPEGWQLNRLTQKWTIDAQAELFLKSVANHPALLAVYGLHEPYWMECEGCGYTTAQMQALYQAIKKIAPVPIYSEINGIAFWAEQGPATTIANGICDYCQTAFYPFLTDGSYQHDELLQHLNREIAALQRHAPQSQLIWTMPAMSHVEDQLRMPTSSEMFDYARLVYAREEIWGAWWYMWRWDDELYPDYLAKHPQLFWTVCEIARTIVADAQQKRSPDSPLPPSVECNTSSQYLPMISHRR